MKNSKSTIKSSDSESTKKKPEKIKEKSDYSSPLKKIREEHNDTSIVNSRSNSKSKSSKDMDLTEQEIQSDNKTVKLNEMKSKQAAGIKTDSTDTLPEETMTKKTGKTSNNTLPHNSIMSKKASFKSSDNTLPMNSIMGKSQTGKSSNNTETSNSVSKQTGETSSGSQTVHDLACQPGPQSGDTETTTETSDSKATGETSSITGTNPECSLT